MRWAAWLLAVAAIASAVSAALAWSGGFGTRVWGVAIRAHGWDRPAILSALALAGAIGLAPRETQRVLERAWGAATAAVTQRLLVVVACAWALCAAVGWGTYAVGGADSYGYAGQARMLAEGRLTDTVIVPQGFTWEGARESLVPLGFRPGRQPGEIAPVYPPGLPLLMALAMQLFNGAIYFVVPAFGLLLVWSTWRLGHALGDGLAGALAALMISLSPTFLFQVVQPMSDVPAAACWLLALLLSSGGSVGRACAAGAAASLAILIRPNLLPLAAIVLAPILVGAGRRTGLGARISAYAAGMAPALVALAWIQAVRYGSPFASGYGSLEYGFSMTNVLPNLARYPRWLTETHTWFVWVAIAAPFWVRRWSRAPVLAWTTILFILAVWGSYLPYAYFQQHEWFYTRFLLPAIPLMLFFACALGVRVVNKLPAAARAPALLAAVVALLVVQIRAIDTRGIRALAEQEAKYPRVAAVVGETGAPTSFIIAGQHSGSLRYYAARPTLRWDLLDPGRLDDAVRALRADGFVPYLVLDRAEERDFADRFGAAGQRAIDGRARLAVVGETRMYGFE